MARKLIVWSVAFVMLSLASLIGLSRLLEASEPDLSVALYPLNVDARVSLLSRRLEAGEADVASVRDELVGVLRTNVGEARLYSLLGEIERRRESMDAADAFFAKARVLSKTDFLALHRMVVRSLETQDLKQAVDLIDIILRRWPTRFSEINPSLVAIVATPDGYDAVLETLKQDAPWRYGLIAALARNPAGVQVAERLLLDLRQTSQPASPSEISAVVAGYFHQRRYEDSYRFFLFSLGPEEQKLSGFIFNGEFAPTSGRRHFDWDVLNRSSLDVSFAESGGMHLRFLNKPVKGAILRQFMQVPPGDYELTVVATGRNLSLPKQLNWRVFCRDGNRQLMSIEMPEGTFTDRSFTGRFSVGLEGCVLQDLRLETDMLAESWRHRYAGSLELKRVRLERLAS